MKTKPKRLLVVLLALCMVLSIVPITAFAESGAYAVIFYPGDYGTMTKNDQIPFVYYGIDYDVNKPYYYKLNVSSTDTLGFAGSIIDTLLPNQGYEFAYWTADATVYQVGNDTAIPAGTALSSDQIQNGVTVKSDVTFTAHFKQIITEAAIENVKLDYQPGNAPQASAKKAGTNQDKYDILFECWEKQEKDANDTMNTVGYWYSDESCYSDGDVRFSTFEKGGRYGYSVKLQAKDGYTFDSNLTNTENVTLNGASLPFGSWVMVMDDGKTCLIQYGTELRPGQAVEKIDFNARINFIAGDKPSFMTSAVNPFIDLDHERWDTNDGSGYGITSSDYWNERYNGKLITEFEAGKSYTYGVYFKISDLGMEEGYRFDKNTKLYINGKEITLTPDQINVDDNGETIWFSNVLTMTPTTVKVIDVVEINNVTVSFKDGDKPVFTGTVPENDQYAFRCEWWSLDENTGIVSTEPEWGGDIYTNKITAFEAGKTYHYGVYVSANTADIAPDAKLKINGREVEYTRIGDENDTQSFWVETNLTMTPAADGHTHSYGTAWKNNSANHWHECSCGEKSELAAHRFKTTTIKATQKKDGSVITKCTVCGAVKSKTAIVKASSVKLSKTTFTYNGKTQKPSVTVKDSKGKTLKNGTDYTVKYSKGCKNVGQYTVTITFKGKYSGTKTLTFKIVPKGTSISKLSSGKKQFTAKWSKQTTQTTGYELQYSTKSSMSGAKTVNVSKNKTTSSTVKKLKSKKKYYVRVRTYKTVKVNGKSVKLYSSWSKVKNVKTK